MKVNFECGNNKEGKLAPALLFSGKPRNDRNGSWIRQCSNVTSQFLRLREGI